MTAIIAATDFSAPATNATHYAAALAQATGARLLLYHHYDYPVQITDLPSVLPLSVDALVDDLIQRLEQIRTDLVRAYGIEIQYLLRASGLLSNLEAIFAAEAASLIIVGRRGGNPVAGALFGSVTTALIRQGKMPVLVVPGEASFHPLKKILFPYDRRLVVDAAVWQPLRELALAFQAEVELLHLRDEDSALGGTPRWEQARAGQQTEEVLQDIRHSYVFAEARALDAGILAEAVRSGADLVAMIPHHHSWLSNLLNRSTTQQVAAGTALPLLVLGEKGATRHETAGNDRR